MQKKFFAWLIATILLISVPALNLNAAEGGFTDIGNHPAGALIRKFTEQGILNGNPDGTFRPDDFLKRAEAVAFLNRFFNITESGYPTFTDVRPTDWHYFYIGAAEDKGYLTGFSDGTFKPDDNIVRLHLYILIYRILGEPAVDNVDLSGFTDQHTIPSDNPIYRQIVSWMAGNDIIEAYPDGSLRVYEYITRAEMLSLLDNVSDMIANENQIYLDDEESTPADDDERPEPTPEPYVDYNNNNSNNNIGNGWPAPKSPGNNWRISPGWLTTTPSSLRSNVNNSNAAVVSSTRSNVNTVSSTSSTRSTQIKSTNDNSDKNSLPASVNLVPSGSLVHKVSPIPTPSR